MSGKGFSGRLKTAVVRTPAVVSDLWGIGRRTYATLKIVVCMNYSCAEYVKG